MLVSRGRNTGLYKWNTALLHFSQTCEFWTSKANWRLHFSLPLIILMDLLGNKSCVIVKASDWFCHLLLLESFLILDGDICPLPVVLKALWTPPSNKCHVPNYKAGPSSSSIIFMSFIFKYSFYTKLDISLGTDHGHPTVIRLNKRWCTELLLTMFWKKLLTSTNKLAWSIKKHFGQQLWLTVERAANKKVYYLTTNSSSSSLAPKISAISWSPASSSDSNLNED